MSKVDFTDWGIEEEREFEIECPSCKIYSNKDRWKESWIPCEVCGDHATIVCPECGHHEDHVHAEGINTKKL